MRVRRYATGVLLSAPGERRLCYCTRLLVVHGKPSQNKETTQTATFRTDWGFSVCRYRPPRVIAENENQQPIHRGSDGEDLEAH